MELANILSPLFSAIVALVMGFFCWLVYKLYEKMEENVAEVDKKNDILAEKIADLTIKVGTAYHMFEKETLDLDQAKAQYKEDMKEIKTMLHIALLDKGQIQRQLDELWGRIGE